MKQRDIAVSVILTIVTCGIYGIYWFIVLTDDINCQSPDNFPSGVVCFLLGIVTCGIYSIYWAYRMGQMIADIKRRRELPGGSDMPIVHLILQIVGLQIVNLALMQNELNRL